MYEGAFKNGKFQGLGKKTFDGQVYKGKFFDNLFDGEGTLMEKDGNTYKGNFLAGKKFG